MTAITITELTRSNLTKLRSAHATAQQRLGIIGAHIDKHGDHDQQLDLVTDVLLLAGIQAALTGITDETIEQDTESVYKLLVHIAALLGEYLTRDLPDADA